MKCIGVIVRVFYLIIIGVELLRGNAVAQSLNMTDKYGRRQGYWKIYLPAFPSELKNNCKEGFYYNDKIIGVWKTSTGQNKVFEERIFFDTTESRIQEIKDYMNGKIKSIGFLFAQYHLDTIRYFYPIVKRQKFEISKTRLYQQGK